MHSDLPDASALEAGILEDTPPSFVSRLQDDVRNLLRGDVLASRRGSTATSPVMPVHSASHMLNGLLTPPESPVYFRDSPRPRLPQVNTNPPMTAYISPVATPEDAIPATSPLSLHNQPVGIPGGAAPPPAGHQQYVAHQSEYFNSRALAALDHPDLSDSSLDMLRQAKAEPRQRRAWKRSRRTGKVHAAHRVETSQVVLCVMSALLLAAIVATYITLASMSDNVTATFHILFVLGILLGTIVFAHSAVRLCVVPRRGSSHQPSPARKVVVAPVARHARRHRHHQRGNRPRHHRTESQTPLHPRADDLPQPTRLGDGAPLFVPPSPIRVHIESDEEEGRVRPDTREAVPSAAAIATRHSEILVKDPITGVAQPPPAYGRWRGSVRADPDLLHWQVVPSPVDSDVPALPSPTYEEAMASSPREQGRTGPPSYATRASPMRVANERSGNASSPVVAPDKSPLGATVSDEEPEMIEVGRGIGFASDM